MTRTMVWLALAALCAAGVGAERELALGRLTALAKDHSEALESFRRREAEQLTKEEHARVALLRELYAALPGGGDLGRGRWAAQQATLDAWDTYHRINYAWRRGKPGSLAERQGRGVVLHARDGTGSRWVHEVELRDSFVLSMELRYVPAGEADAMVSLAQVTPEPVEIAYRADVVIPARRWVRLVLERREDVLTSYVDGAPASVVESSRGAGRVVLRVPRGDTIYVRYLRLESWEPAL